MRRPLAISLVLLIAFVAAAAAWDIERSVPTSVSEGVPQAPMMTFYYGGTVYDAAEERWEAAEPLSWGRLYGNMWTFSSAGFNGVPHSGQNMDGWIGVDNDGACGDYAHAAHLNDLTLDTGFDPCSIVGPGICEMADSVLVLFDESTPEYRHPLCQDNYAMSPVIDLANHPGLQGRMLYFETLLSQPLLDHVFMYWRVRYSPGSGPDGWSSWVSDNCAYYSTELFARCSRRVLDVSAYIPPSAEEVQVGLGVVNYCDEDPWGLGCTYVCRETPYFDNVMFGVYLTPEVPHLAMRGRDYYQDQFAEDGTLNPTSTADTRVAGYQGDLVPPVFGDTLSCVSSDDNIEVWLVFRMAAVSPKQTVTAPFFTWFPGVQAGGWFASRMDTAEVTNVAGTGTEPTAGRYMSCFHETDPHWSLEGTEILPNNVFVPGTRIEYYLKACYASSADTFYLPADGPSDPEEFEVLPMYVDDGAGSVEWPCLIYVDHFGQRGNGDITNSDRTAAALTAAGYEFDVFHKLGPSSDLRNGIGRWAANAGQMGGPGTSKYNWGPGATIDQFVAYSHAMVNCGDIRLYSMYEPDATMLQSWLTVYTDSEHPRFLWMSGDAWVWALQNSPYLYTRAFAGAAFLNDVMGTTYVASTFHGPDPDDFSYCLPVNSVSGGAIVSGVEPYYVRENGCPREFDKIGVIGAGVAEEEYDSQETPDYAAVSNAPDGTYYATFTEGYDWCLMRDGAAGYPTCGVDPLAGWFSSVLGWSGLVPSAVCDLVWAVDVKEPGVAPAVVTSLGQAFPNPMNPTATIKYTIGTPGRAQLRVFDVSGRVIRTLVDEAKTTGVYSVVWDGKNDGGERVGSSVFFYQLETPVFRSAKKIVILK